MWEASLVHVISMPFARAESDPRAGAPMMTLQPSNLGASNGAPLPDFDREHLPPANAAFGKPIRRQECSRCSSLPPSSDSARWPSGCTVAIRACDRLAPACDRSCGRLVRCLLAVAYGAQWVPATSPLARDPAQYGTRAALFRPDVPAVELGVADRADHARPFRQNASWRPPRSHRALRSLEGPHRTRPSQRASFLALPRVETSVTGY